MPQYSCRSSRSKYDCTYITSLSACRKDHQASRSVPAKIFFLGTCHHPSPHILPARLSILSDADLLDSYDPGNAAGCRLSPAAPTTHTTAMMMVFLLLLDEPAPAALSWTGAIVGLMLGGTGGVIGRPATIWDSGAIAAGAGAGTGAVGPLVCCISTISTFSRFRPVCKSAISTQMPHIGSHLSQ